MLETMQPRLHQAGRYLIAFGRWTVLALALGALCGGVGALFHHTVEEAGALFREHGWLLYLLPLAGLGIVFLYRRAGVYEDRGANLVLRSLRRGEVMPIRIAPLIFAATALTQLCGGSAGREGAALQIGAALSACVSQVLKFSGEKSRVLTLSGMAGLFSAVFGTPVAAAVFSMEVSTVGVLRYGALYPGLLASLTAWEVSRRLGGTPTRFRPPELPGQEGALVFLKVALLALLCALCSILFLTLLHRGEHLAQRHLDNPYLRAAVCGGLVIALTLLLGTRDFNGAGMAYVPVALAGGAAPLAFLAKIVMTAVTIAGGYKGGEIVPTFFVGAAFGGAVGPLLGLDAGFAAAMGMIALFCSVVNCPLASLVLAVEIFSDGPSDAGLLACFALTCALSYFMSGSYSLYKEQRIRFSKLEDDVADPDGE